MSRLTPAPAPAAPNGDTMHEVYARHANCPASPSDIEEFERRFGPSLPPDDEG